MYVSSIISRCAGGLKELRFFTILGSTVFSLSAEYSINRCFPQNFLISDLSLMWSLLGVGVNLRPYLTRVSNALEFICLDVSIITSGLMSEFRFVLVSIPRLVVCLEVKKNH